MAWRTLLAAGLAVPLVALAGCYESPDATNYDPGVYKGKNDPLLAKQEKEAQQETLRQRFRAGQTDR